MSVSSMVGLLEAIAWIGSRDWAWADEAQRQRAADVELGSGGCRGIVAWFWLEQALLDDGKPTVGTIFNELAEHCTTGKPVALGLRSGQSGYQAVGCNDWVGAKLEELCDGIRVASPNGEQSLNQLLNAGESACADSDYWRLVRFKRSDLTAVWPALVSSPVAPAPSRKRTSKDSLRRKVLRKFIQRYAVPNEWLLEGGEHYRTQEDMHGVYVTLCRKEHPPVKPYQLSAFKRWLTRFNRGEWA